MKTSASEPGLSIPYYDNQSWYPDFGLFGLLVIYYAICAKGRYNSQH